MNTPSNTQVLPSAHITLPMYDIAECRPATAAVLSAIAAELTAAGWPVADVFGDFADHAALVAHWRSDDVALSQACGLPYLEDLDDVAAIVGTFRWAGVSDANGRYRSQIIVRSDDARSLESLRGAQPVINNPESLSGWCSLGSVLAQAGYGEGDFPRFIVSGAHLRSIEAIREGRADVASIDSASLSLLRRHRPQDVEGIRVIGEGPVVPATPLITRKNPPIALDAVRASVTAALARPEVLAARETLGIEGFVALADADCRPIAALERLAASVLPRLGDR